MATSILVPIKRSPPFLPRSTDQQALSLLLQQNPTLKSHHIKQVHAQFFRKCLQQDNILITKLITVCSDSGNIKYSEKLFDYADEPDLVLCNSMLRAFIHNDFFAEALAFYVQMVENGFSPDHFTLPYVFKACSALSCSYFGLQVHGSLVKHKGHSDNVFILNSLIDMYFKFGFCEFAYKLFAEIKSPNSTSWNVLIGGLLNSGHFELARKMFDEMPVRDIVSWNTMISACAKTGDVVAAVDIFNRMPERNLVSWNALIACFSHNGRNNESLSIFSQMLKLDIEPDDTTILMITSALADARYIGPKVIDQIVKLVRKYRLVSVRTAILNLYAKFGLVDDARKMFDQISEKDLVAWNVMIGGYAQNLRPVDAIELFREMQSVSVNKIQPDELTMVSLVSSCAQIGALGLGEWVHAFIKKHRIKVDSFLRTSLINMYATCGDLNQAHLLFVEMPDKDLASFNAMIKAFAIHGQGNESIHLLDQMERHGISPNAITFVGLLHACSHGGLTDEGLELFHAMVHKYGISPRIEHYGCVVDLLGRAGRLNDAYKFVMDMPIKPDSVVWGALLGSCRSHQNSELAEIAAQKLVELDPTHDGNYVLLSNVYASMGRWDDVNQVRTQMKVHNVRKTPGHSIVELEGIVHEFTAGDRSHLRSDEIYIFLDKLIERLKPMGYVPDTKSSLRNLDEEDKEESLYRHSEKLALSLAIMSSQHHTTPIRIVKNLRICGDCHKMMELVSKLECREIIVRDRARFHHFNGGQCSCGGYW